MSRELTREEVRERFLTHVRNLVTYWEKSERAPTAREKLEGVAFSILVAIDGGAMGLPSFILAPNPHPEDKPYHQENKEDWWPENHHLDEGINCDIAGGLHEGLFRKQG